MADNIELITKNRIDIVIGIEYVDFYENNYNTDFFIDLYIEHKRAFNGLYEKEYRGKKEKGLCRGIALQASGPGPT